jgi:hypothetical protein
MGQFDRIGAIWQEGACGMVNLYRLCQVFIEKMAGIGREAGLGSVFFPADGAD